MARLGVFSSTPARGETGPGVNGRARTSSAREASTGQVGAFRRVVAALAAIAAVAAGMFVGAPAAVAAPGDPFPAADPLVFVAQGNPTGLFTAVTDDSGTVAFAPEGPVSNLIYNAIGYNTADNYVYAYVNTGNAAIPSGSLIRIGQEGVITRVGTATYPASISATFGPNGNFYLVGGPGLSAINVATGATVGTTPLSGDALAANDIAFKDGFFWAMGNGFISRTNPASGVTVRFTAPFIPATDQAGAAWTFGNGNLGFSYNTSGTVYQVAITNPAAAAPAFALVATSDGPASSNNDGSASPGQPTDLSIVKTGPQALVPGGTATYTLTVTNNGPGNSSGFVVNDTVPAALTNVASPDDACTVTGNALECVGGRLEAGDSVTFTVTASVPSGITSAVENTATVTSNEQDPTPGNNTSTTTAGIAGISVVKNAGVPVDVNGNGLTDAGDTIQYTFDVTNTGEVPLTAITVDDPKVGAVTCAEPGLAVGATQTCEAAEPYTITAADVSNGSVDNSATASGTTPDGDPITSTPSTTSTPTTAPAPAITIVKTATPLDEDEFLVGQEITYSFTVANTGNVPLNDVSVVEGEFTGSGELSAITCPATTLAVDAEFICTATYTLTQADVDAGSVENSATAEGTPPGEDTPTGSTPSEVTVPVAAEPGLTVVKTADVETITTVGEVVTYSFLVTNTGELTITDPTINEVDFSGTGELSAITCPDDTLDPGEEVLCTATYAVTQADLDSGELSNVASVTGTTPDGGPTDPSDPSEVTIPVTEAPELDVVKSSDVATITTVGQTVTYSFLVTNTGNVTLSDVTVDDTEFSGSGELSPLSPASVATLAPGESATFTATYAVTQADLDSGTLTNTAVATGTTPDGDPTPPSDPSTEEIPATPTPAIEVVKTATPAAAGAVGDEITYTFVATNTGNVTLTDVSVDEGDFSGTGELSSIAPASVAALAPGASATFTATYVLTQADVDAGSVTNSATVVGTPPGADVPVESDPSDAEVTIDPAPGLAIVKSSDVESISTAGETVTYTFAVTNTGNVTLTDVTVDDTEFSGAGELSPLTPGSVATLAPGATATFTATYVVTQADIDSGTLTNTAVATGTTPEGEPTPPSDPSTEIVPVTPAPAIEVVKSADVTSEEFAAGTEVTYSFVATNTGNVTLTEVSIDEGQFSGTGELSAVTPESVATLAPGESATFTATYVLTQADVDAGSVTNDATATGTPPAGDPVSSDPSEATVPVDEAPGLAIVKTSDAETISTEGQTVTYSFRVTNTGNVTITDPVINETDFTGTGELSPITGPEAPVILLPGESAVYTATYAVTQADLDAGTLSNTATATGTPPSGTPVDSTPSTEEVPTDPMPALEFVKSVDKSRVVGAGQTITYTFTITNTGNVTQNNVGVTETDFTGAGELGAITCEAGAAALAPGETVICTATYQTTEADVAAGEVANTAVATGTPTVGDPTTSESSTVRVPIAPAPGGLAATGSAPLGGLLVAAGLLLAGAILIPLANRRRREDATRA
jgi:uncharacterized repeat protein (TIGR01451 family)